MNLSQTVKNTDCFLLDLDGTVYLSQKPIGDMVNTLNKLRGLGKRLVFLTNNSSKCEEEYTEDLKKCGLFGKGDSVFTSGEATARYLLAHGKAEKVLPFACDSLKQDFLKSGLSFDFKEPETALLAYDKELDYNKIAEFSLALSKGAYYVATHCDLVCPSQKGNLPDVGSFIKMFEASSGRLPDIIIGKPNVAMGEYILQKFCLKKSRVTMVGDRLYTDIRFANNCGFNSILVLSGDTNEQILKSSTDKPQFVLSDLNEITKFL